MVKQLLEAGADKDARDGYELTALHKVSFISGAWRLKMIIKNTEFCKIKSLDKTRKQQTD